MPRRRPFQTSVAVICVALALAVGGAAVAAPPSRPPEHAASPTPDGDARASRLAALSGASGAPAAAAPPVAAPAVAAALSAAVPTAPPATVGRSWYVNELTGRLSVDAAHATARGCAQARRSAPGLVTLGFGRQTAGGVTAFNRRRPTSLAHVVTIASAFATGLERCGAGTGQWVLLLAVSNFGGATRHNGASGGAAWALVVEVAARMSAGNPHVVVGGGIDMEPAWGPPAQGRAWVDGFVGATDRMLVNFGSADLCSRTPGRTHCANGWTQDDVIHVSTAAGPSVWVAPEVYDHKGIMAGQWVNIARRADQSGTPLRFAGVMTQQAACIGSTETACTRLNLSPADAWAVLVGGLDAARVRRTGPFLSTDIGWGWRR